MINLVLLPNRKYRLSEHYFGYRCLNTPITNKVYVLVSSYLKSSSFTNPKSMFFSFKDGKDYDSVYFFNLLSGVKL